MNNNIFNRSDDDLLQEQKSLYAEKNKLTEKIRIIENELNRRKQEKKLNEAKSIIGKCYQQEKFNLNPKSSLKSVQAVKVLHLLENNYFDCLYVVKNTETQYIARGQLDLMGRQVYSLADVDKRNNIDGFKEISEEKFDRILKDLSCILDLDKDEL